MVRDCPECYEDGYQAGAEAMLQQVRSQGIPSKMDPARAKRVAILKEKAKPKRKPTAANRKYAVAFQKSKPRFMKKNGGWKKNGFRNCSRAAHKMCK